MRLNHLSCELALSIVYSSLPYHRNPAFVKSRAFSDHLFIGADSDQPGELLAQARGHPVLTVTEAETAHPEGSVINFAVADERVRFDISRAAAERNALQLRSQLLAVARHVSS